MFEDASLPESDVDRCIIIKKLPNLFLNHYRNEYRHTGYLAKHTGDFSSVRLPAQGVT
jgi:hypothetical protein